MSTLVLKPSPLRRAVLHRGTFALLGLTLCAACESGKVPEPKKEPAKPAAVASATPVATASATAKPRSALNLPRPPRKISAKPVAEVKPAPGDPVQGKFSLDDALKGLPAGEGPLTATIETDQEPLVCELWPDKAPITVANFVGLARGNRPWKKGDKWVKEPLYTGTVFHRVVKGFMIQGGDPNKDGSGGPGYEIPDEIWEDAHHDAKGLICMANRGPNTNGSQFFIMDGQAPHLDGGYTIFGKCGPESAIDKIADTKVERDRAVNPPKIKKIVISRAAAKK
jgi:peptidyl-prolyl cis-trans isomerase A (cyclophilin A)